MEVTNFELRDREHQAQAYVKIPASLVGKPAMIPVKSCVFTCGACDEQKVPRHMSLRDGVKSVFISGCMEMQGQREGEEEISSGVKGKRWISGNTSKQLLGVTTSASSGVGGNGKLQDLRGRYKTVCRGCSEVNFNGASSSKRKMVEDRDLRPWSELPEALLDLIAKELNMEDYIRFGSVCRSWKLYVAANKQDFMASQAPLILLISPLAKRSCYFYNLFDNKISKALLPSLVGKKCVGITGGYLVMINKNKNEGNPVWLVNPITRRELHFPSTPHCLDRVILASLSMPRGEFIIVSLSIRSPFLQFCRSTDDHWTICRLATPPDLRLSHFIHGAFFKGKIYFLTNHGEIAQFDPRSPPFYNKLEVQTIPNPTWNMQLVASDDQLLVVKRDNSNRDYTVYKLEPLMKLWTEVESLADQALFLVDCRGNLGFCPKTKWKGGQNAHNNIFGLASFYDSASVQTLDGGSTKWVPVPTIRGAKAFWYFPQLACNVDILCQ